MRFGPMNLDGCAPLLLLFLLLWALGGCHTGAPPTTLVHRVGTMPANTVLFSTLVSDLASQPGLAPQLTAALARPSKSGAAILSPDLAKALQTAIQHQELFVLDTFPGWKVRDIDASVGATGAISGEAGPVSGPEDVNGYVDLGIYALGQPQQASLDLPSSLPGLDPQGLIAPVVEGVVQGDGPNPETAAMHSESARLAQVMNRLSLNRLDGAATMTASLDGIAAQTPEGLLHALLATGHEVTVADARSFANLGHLHYEGADVMMPFWVNVQVLIPGTEWELHVPLSHAELEWTIRGPRINANVAFYFGMDGKAEFRTMDQLDQAWVMGRHAHEYRGADAVETTRLTGLLVLAYARAHLAHPSLPLGGYYALGVCQDGVAAVEQKMTGATTLFPLTADAALFNDPRDGEIEELLAAAPKDRGGNPPALERVFGSLPTTDLASTTIPGLAADLESVYAAWHDGSIDEGPHRDWSLWLTVAGCIALALLLRLMVRQRRARAVAR